MHGSYNVKYICFLSNIFTVDTMYIPKHHFDLVVETEF